MTTQQINISFSSAMADTIRIHTGETGRVIVFTPDILLEQDQSAEIIIVKPDNTFVIDDATISNGLIIVTIPEQAGAVSGVGGYILKVYEESLCIYSASGPLMVDDHLLTDGMIESVAEVHGYIFPNDFLTDDDIVINPASPAFATLTKIKYKGITYKVDGGAEDLNDLTDVTLTNPETGEVLTYDGQKWVNEALYIPDDLNDLDDVEISAPSDGQQLVYNDGVWENQTITPVISKTATGNPIELTDAASAPMVKCVTQITGSQDLHGYDKPWVGGAGANLFRPGESKTYTENGITFTSDGNGVYTIKGTASSDASCSFNVTPYVTPNGSNTTISYINSQSVGGVSFGFYYNSTMVDSWSMAPMNRAYYGFSALSQKNVDAYVITVQSGTTVDMTISPMFISGDVTQNLPSFSPYENICPIMAYTEGEIEVSDGDGNTTTHTTTYPSAIFRGGEDVVNGTVGPTSDGEEWIAVDLGSLTWQKATNVNRFYSTGLNTTIKKAASLNVKGDIICEKYDTETANQNYQQNIGIAVDTSGTIFIYDPDRVGDSEADFTTYITGTKIAFALDTPTTTPVTTTNLPIRTLSGYTHIESTTGDMEVEYITKTYEPIIKAVEQLLPASTRSIQSTIAKAPQEIQKIVLEDEKEVGEEDAILKLTEEEGGEENADQRLTDE